MPSAPRHTLTSTGRLQSLFVCMSLSFCAPTKTSFLKSFGFARSIDGYLLKKSNYFFLSNENDSYHILGFHALEQSNCGEYILTFYVKVKGILRKRIGVFSCSFCRHLLVGEKREGTKVLMSPQNLPTPRNQPTCSALKSTENIKTSTSPHSSYTSQPNNGFKIVIWSVFDLDSMANGKR